MVFLLRLTQVSAFVSKDGINASSHISFPAKAPPITWSLQSSNIDFTSVIAEDILPSLSFTVALADALKPPS